MTYDDLIDWLEDEDNYNWDDWTDFQELYEDIQRNWSGKAEFPMSLDKFVDMFEDEPYNFVSIGNYATEQRQESLINWLFGE